MAAAKSIAAALRSLGAPLGTLVEGLLLLTGAGAVAYGAWMAYRPAGPIVGGVLLIAGVILRARGA
jgi:hypothetical protein